MKNSRVVVLGIAFVAAAGAAFLAKNIVGETRTERVVQKEFMNTTRVLVASKKIKIGELVQSNMMTWQTWPKDALNRSLIDEATNKNAIQDFNKSIARTSYEPGEPISQDKLIKKNQGGVMAAILTPGMRAVSTKIKEETAAGGFILPNDHVDVILAQNVKGRNNDSKHISRTILTNVRVLAIGQNIEQQKGEKTAMGKTTTLELSIGQAEILAMAEKMGTLSLALRSLSENLPGSPGDGGKKLNGDRGNAVRMIKFGRPIRAFGVQ